jgi:hypothetical protein
MKKGTRDKAQGNKAKGKEAKRHKGIKAARGQGRPEL